MRHESGCRGGSLGNITKIRPSYRQDSTPSGWERAGLWRPVCRRVVGMVWARKGIVTIGATLALFAIVPQPATGQDNPQPQPIRDLAALTVAVPQDGAQAIDIDALTLDSDFTVFMDQKCPEKLRLQALRRLWRLLPPVALAENSAI